MRKKNVRDNILVLSKIKPDKRERENNVIQSISAVKRRWRDVFVL